jgi:hypothetical protein
VLKQSLSKTNAPTEPHRRRASDPSPEREAAIAAQPMEQYDPRNRPR